MPDAKTHTARFLIYSIAPGQFTFRYARALLHGKQGLNEMMKCADNNSPWCHVISSAAWPAPERSIKAHCTGVNVNGEGLIEDVIGTLGFCVTHIQIFSLGRA